MHSALSSSIDVQSMKSIGHRVLKLRPGQNLDEKFDLDLLEIGQGQKFLWHGLRLIIIYPCSKFEIFRSKGIKVTDWTKFG